MLEHLHKRIVTALQGQTTVTVATSGTAGLEISPCESKADGLNLILLILLTSEHLVNIEENPEVAITQDYWRLIGQVVAIQSPPPNAGIESSMLLNVRVRPSCFEFLTADTHQVIETIDISEND